MGLNLPVPSPMNPAHPRLHDQTLSRNVSGSIVTLLGRFAVYPGKPVAISEITPKLALWLFRPASMATRLGERRYVTEAHVVEEDDDDVRCTFRRLHLEPLRGFGLARIELGDWRIRRLCNRQHCPVELTLGRRSVA